MHFVYSALLLLSSFSLFGQTLRISFQAPLLYPEGIAYDEKNKVFYVSSVTSGIIGAVDVNGNYRKVYSDKDLKSSFGMKFDTKTNMLWVCLSDPNFSTNKAPDTFKKMARIIQIDVAKGTKVKDLNLGSFLAGNHFANDLTLDSKGNIYITDSYSPVIYKVDAMGKENVFVENDIFKSIDVGLNGIVWHPEGYLLVAHNTNGCIYKVSLSNPDEISKVGISTFFPGADGLLLDKKKNIILVQNKGANKVFRLVSMDNWKTAQVESATSSDDRFAYPTSATLKQDQIYVINSKMNELQDSTLGQSNEFSIQQVEFKSVK